MGINDIEDMVKIGNDFGMLRIKKDIIMKLFFFIFK